MAGAATQLKRIIGYMKPYRLRVGLGISASLGIAVANGAFAWMVGPGVDHFLVDQRADLMIYIPVFVIGISALKGLSRFVQNYYMKTAASLMVRDVQDELFTTTVNQPMAFFGQNSVGGLMSRITSDVSVMQNSITQAVVDLMREGSTIIGLTAVALYRDWQMALVVFTVMPLVGLISSRIGRRIKTYSRKGQAAIGALSQVAEQAFSGIKVLKSFDAEGQMQNRFEDENRSRYQIVRKRLKYSALTAPCTEILTSIGLSAVVWVGVTRTLNGQMTSGELVSVITAVGLIYGPTKKLAHINNVLQQSLGAADRVFEILDLKKAIQRTESGPDLQVKQGEICFDSVDFSYGNDKIFDQLDLDVRSGERLALVGPSGSGKTTLASLLSRFFEPQGGQILIDGQHIKSVNLESLRANIAMVDQESTLFNDSIVNNIRMGTPEASLAQVQQAAKLAYADGFIDELPEQYETQIGDRGLRLSGGQRQRLCIARAILKNAPILILDEATSALDTESESMVHQALDNLMQGRTTVIIAHRLSTIKGADRIIVLNKGRIEEVGTHDALIEGQGLYRRLYEMQFQQVETPTTGVE